MWVLLLCYTVTIFQSVNRINVTHILWVSNISGKTSHIRIVATRDYPHTDKTSHAIYTYIYDLSSYWTSYAYLLFFISYLQQIQN